MYFKKGAEKGGGADSVPSRKQAANLGSTDHAVLDLKSRKIHE